MKGIEYKFKDFDATTIETGAGLPNEKKYDKQLHRLTTEKFEVFYGKPIDVKLAENIRIAEQRYLDRAGFGNLTIPANPNAFYAEDEDLVLSTTSASPNPEDRTDNRTKSELVMHYEFIVKRKDALIEKLIDKLDESINLIKTLKVDPDRPTYSPSPSDSLSPSESASPSPDYY